MCRLAADGADEKITLYAQVRAYSAKHEDSSMGKSWRQFVRFVQFLLADKDAAPTALDGVLTYGLQGVQRDGLFVPDAPAKGSRFTLDQLVGILPRRWGMS
jgi:hypothetical protein